MNAKETAKMRRLEIENEELKRMQSKHFDVYRSQAVELINLRTRLRLVEEAVRQPEPVQ